MDSIVHFQPIFQRLGYPSECMDGLPIRGKLAGQLNIGCGWRQSILHFAMQESFNGLTNSSDLNIIALNWRDSISIAGSPTATAPEPAGILLVILAAVTILDQRR